MDDEHAVKYTDVYTLPNTYRVSVYAYDTCLRLVIEELGRKPSLLRYYFHCVSLEAEDPHNCIF